MNLPNLPGGRDSGRRGPRGPPKPFRGRGGSPRVATFGQWAILLAALATLAVAAFVLFLDFAQRVHRAFALFLLLRAMLDGLFFFSGTTTDLAGRLRMYWYIAVPFAALHFAMAYRRRHGRRAQPTPGWLVPLGILAVALAFEVAFLLDHGLAGTPAKPGPFLAFVFLPWPVYAAMSLLFAVEHGHASRPGARKALELAAFGMSLAPLYFVVFELSLLAYLSLQGPVPWDALSAAQAVAYAIALALLVEAGRRLLGASTLGRGRLLAWWGLAVASALGTVVLFSTVEDGRLVEGVLQALLAAWALPLPVLVTHALVRHRLFDAEVKLRFAVKGSTVAAVFLAVFFVVSQVAQNFLSTRGGLLVGGVVTGLVLFAINPLQHFADRLARRAVPGPPLLRGTRAERIQLYREQLEIAWADGRLTSKERLLFARLQERLGIGADEAARLETEVIAALARPPARPPAGPKAAA
jgi:hypothetical protein